MLEVARRHYLCFAVIGEAGWCTCVSCVVGALAGADASHEPRGDWPGLWLPTAGLLRSGPVPLTTEDAGQMMTLLRKIC
eukprot:2878865-Rhodomonas_salina.3